MERKRIHLLYSILLSSLLILAGLCLIVACVGIYNAGDQPFSREAVAAAFRRIRIPVYLCLAGILAGFLLDLLLPEKANPPRLQKPWERILDTWLKKVDLTLCDPGLRQEIFRLEKQRRIRSFVSGLLLGLGSTVFLVFSANGSNFHDSRINESMLRAVYVLLATMAIPVCYGIFRAFTAVSGIRREIDLLKQAPNSARRAVPPERKPPAVNKSARILRTVVLCAALILLVLGYCTGGTADVMTKAINICTECVGLG